MPGLGGDEPLGGMPTTGSVRQRIITTIDLRLKTILVANGYQSNMGEHVFGWRTDPFQGSEIDGLTYRDRTEERTAGCGVYDLMMPLEIEMISDSPAGIRKCLADLEKAVFVDETWGGLAWYTELRTNEMAVEKKEELFSASKIILEIEYQTGRGHPD